MSNLNAMDGIINYEVVHTTYFEYPNINKASSPNELATSRWG